MRSIAGIGCRERVIPTVDIVRHDRRVAREERERVARHIGSRERVITALGVIRHGIGIADKKSTFVAGIGLGLREYVIPAYGVLIIARASPKS